MAGMQFWNGRRARRRLPRIRGEFNFNSDKPSFSNIVGFKVGMLGVSLIESSSAAVNVEDFKGASVVEIPETEVYGIKFYKIDPKTNYEVSSDVVYDDSLISKLNIKNIKNKRSDLDKFKEKLSTYEDVAALLVTYPKTATVDQNHIQKYESRVIGGDINAKFDYIVSYLGKKISPEEVFNTGEYADVSSVTNGKGWAGVIKRKGVRRQFHKATEKIRLPGPLGAFTPGKILYTVPRAGQMGYNYRTDKNKLILKVGDESTDNINPKAGFMNYGMVKNHYVIISGSIPGVPKRVVRIRKSYNLSKPNKEMSINYINTVN